MDPLGIFIWIVTALIVAVVVWLVGERLEPAPLMPQAAYIAVAASLATFMGSEAFSWISEKGPEVDGFYILTGAAFGLAVTALAAVAARTPAPEVREEI